MKSSTKALASLVRSGKSIYITDAIVMVLSNAFEALVPLFFGLAVGSAVSDGSFTNVGTYALTALLLNMAHMVLWHAGDFWVIGKVYKDTFRLRNQAYKSVWDYSYADFIDKPSGKIAASITNLQESARYLYDSIHYGFFSIGVYYVTLMLSVGSVSWHNTVIYAVFMCVAIAILSRQTKVISRTKQKYADSKSEQDGKVFDSIANFTNVFSFHAKHKEIRMQAANTKQLRKSQYIADKAVMNFWVVAAFLMRWLLWAVILYVNYSLYKQGTIDQAGFAAAIAVLTSFTGQYWNLVHHISEFGGRVASYNQYYSYLFGSRNIFDNEHASLVQPKLSMAKSLEIAQVSFAYPDTPSKPALQDINIAFHKHQKIGIVGKSGGGKSTIIKLLLGFYEPTSGSICIDGKPASPDMLRSLISYVPQDTTLFQETIAYNIGYAANGIVSQKDIELAAKKAHAHEFISRLKDGYQTMVGERGVKLSLGQRQRIALARAFLKDSDVLVMDEATSSLDSKTEKDIQDSLESLWKHKTVIAIAHRLSTLNNVDYIYVIEGGYVVEHGTKQELLTKNGMFAELWNHQKDGLI